LFGGDCAVDPQTNIVTVSDMINATLPDNTLVKMMIKQGTNPPGARESGSWSIKTQIEAAGVWYTVDNADSPESFYARPGYINSQLELTSKMTYDTDTSYNIECETEHDIPREG
jgi:hypothetical protein